MKFFKQQRMTVDEFIDSSYNEDDRVDVDANFLQHLLKRNRKLKEENDTLKEDVLLLNNALANKDIISTANDIEEFLINQPSGEVTIDGGILREYLLDSMQAKRSLKLLEDKLITLEATVDLYKDRSTNHTIPKYKLDVRI